MFYDSAVQMYEIEKENLVTDFFKENLCRESTKENRKKYFENFANAIATLTKHRVKELKSKFDDDKIEIHAESVIKSENLQLKYNHRMKMACVGVKKLINFFKYEKSLDECLENYHKILSKHEKEEMVIRDQKIALDELNREIRDLNGNLVNVEYFHLTKVNEMKSEKNFLQKIFHELNDQMKIDTQKDQKKIEFLVSSSQKIFQTFNEKYQKQKKILSLLNLVEKHEKISDLEINTENDGNPGNCQNEILIRKIANVQAENILLKDEMKYLTKKNKEIGEKIIQLNIQEKIHGNCEFLGFDQNLSISGEIIPIQHVNLMPQIVNMIKKQHHHRNCE